MVPNVTGLELENTVTILSLGRDHNSHDVHKTSQVGNPRSMNCKDAALVYEPELLRRSRCRSLPLPYQEQGTEAVCMVYLCYPRSKLDPGETD